MSIVNVAAYKFATLTQLHARRQVARRLCDQHSLRGTILLASEGINLFVAGSRVGVDALLTHLQRDPEIGLLEPKESFTNYQPFRRMLVKIKREIISLGVEGINPALRPGRKISPRELKSWLDQRHELVLLDTRNDYEVKLGTFVGAATASIGHFRDFPAAARNFPDAWRTTPLVMFCTGGIRCEKAAPLLEQLGYQEVYQLDGGILKYFEEVGQDHYQGDCFVFDQRVAVDAALRETDAAQCYACQAILTAEEQQSPHFRPGESCPYCYVPPQEHYLRLLQQRQQQLREVTAVLPGSLPYDNYRPVYVPARLEGWNVVDFLAEMAPAMGRDNWQQQIAAGRILRHGQSVTAATTVRAGERYDHFQPQVLEPQVASDIDIVYEDAALVVVNKPAPLPIHPCGRFNKNTLSKLLEPIYRPERLRHAHRLDANTSGLIVFTRTGKMAQRLQPQFSRGEVAKTYLALVRGQPDAAEFTSDAAIAPTTRAGGVRLLDDEGLAALTRFRVLARFSDHTTLLEVYPVTGRTNQIRVHLWGLGLPIVGDPTYGENGTFTAQQALAVGDPPMCLHAWRLAFAHPGTGHRIALTAPLPDWCRRWSTDWPAP